MITRIEIDGFKSLQGFALDLEPLSALIGPNGAGKSNLLDALSLLARIAAVDLATAFKEGRGRTEDQFARSQEEPVAVARGYGRLAGATFAVEILRFQPSGSHGPPSPRLTATRLRYEVEIELQQLMPEPPRQRLVVVREALRALPSSNDAWMTRHPAFVPHARHGDGSAIFELNRGGQLSVADPGAPELAEKNGVIQYVPLAAFLSTPHILGRSPHARAMSEELRGLRVLHLAPSRLRETCDRSAPASLAADGAGLPAVLAELMGREDPTAAAQVRADLASLVPGIRGFTVTAEGDGLAVEIESADGQRFPSPILSDGTLRILALSALLRAGPEGALVAIEEPENGLYPARMRTLVERLLDAVTADEPPQVLVTSHSPVVLAALVDHPESISCFDMVRYGSGLRQTRVRTVAPAGVIDRERYVSSGELRRILEAASPTGTGEP